MNSSDSKQHDGFETSKSNRRMGRRSAGGLAVVALLAVYSFAQPKLNERFGWNLPGLRQDHRGQVVVDESKTPDARSSGQSASSSSIPTPKLQPAKSGASSTASSTTSSSGKSGANAPIMLPSKDSSSSGGSKKNTSSGLSDDGELLYGILRDTGSKRYVSPQGLMYTPGSAEGHRLEHLRRHTEDQPNRAGSHGVFDGEMAGALKTIDRAYDRAKKNQKTTKKTDRGRTVYTVDMGGRVGYVGGRTGKQRRNPMARRVQLVLEGNRVITAYPK